MKTPNFKQFSVPIQCAVTQVGDHYSLIAFPTVDLPDSTEPVAVAMFFRVVDGKVVESTTNPDQWNAFLETQRQESA